MWGIRKGLGILSNPCHLDYMQHFDLGNRLLTGHRNPGSGLRAYGFEFRG